MRRTPLAVIIALNSLACADTDKPVGPVGEDRSDAVAFSNGGSGGLAAFQFLPPLAMSDAMVDSDGGALLELLAVEICERTGDACVTPLIHRITAEDGVPSGLRWDPEEQFYNSLWMTNSDNLDPTKVYRIRVVASGQVLGWADAHVDAGGRGGAGVSFKAGSTVPIKFRIAPLNASEIDASGGLVLDVGTGASLSFAPAFFQAPTTLEIGPSGNTSSVYAAGSHPILLKVTASDDISTWSGGATATISIPILPSALPGRTVIRAEVPAFPSQYFWADADVVTDAIGNEYATVEVRPSDLSALLTSYGAQQVGSGTASVSFLVERLTDVATTPALSSAALAAAARTPLSCNSYPFDHDPESADMEPGAQVLVLVHGFQPLAPDCFRYLLLGSHVFDYFDVLLPLLHEQFPDWVIMGFSWDTYMPWQDASETFASRLSSFVASEAPSQVAVLAHSAGGLVAAHALQGTNGQALARGLITMGTPFTGTKIAWGAIAGGLALPKFIRVIPSPGLSSLLPGLPLPTELTIPTYAYYGDVSGRLIGQSITYGEFAGYSFLCYVGECENDSVVEEPSSTAIRDLATLRPFDYAHSELYEGLHHSGDPSDPVYAQLFADLEALMANDPDDPIAYYPLDGNGSDISGNGFHGSTYTFFGGGPTANRHGVAGTAMRFVGLANGGLVPDEGVVVPHAGLLSDPSMNELTLVSWIRTMNVTGFSNGRQRLVSKGTNSFFNYSLYLQDGRAAITAWQAAGAAHLLAEGTSNIADGNWHLVVGTIRDGQAAKIYVDGVLQATDQTPQGTWNRVGTGDFAIGRYPADPQLNANINEPYDGDIDDVRVYRRAMTDQEVVDLYNAEKPTGSPGGSGPRVYYSFDGCSASDDSGNGNHGTLVGGLGCDTGVAGNALSYDGIDDHVIPSYSLDAQSFSFCAWINNTGPQTNSPSQSIFGGRTGTTASIVQLFTQQAGNPYLWAQHMGLGSSPPRPTIATNISVQDGQWHHVCYTSGAMDVRLYLDGSLIGTVAQMTSGPLPGTGLIGAYWDSGSLTTHFFRGMIDEAYLFARQISDVEVANLASIVPPAPQAPSVSTLSEQSVTSSGFEARGSVTANGSATDVWFEWGTDGSLATFQSTARQPVGGSATGLLFDASISGLTADTDYFYRAVAENVGGLVRGGIEPVRTGAGLPLPDLVATDFYDRNFYATGFDLQYEVEVTNLGGPMAAIIQFGADVYLSTDATITPGDVLIGSLPGGGRLGAGSGVTLSGIVNVPTSVAAGNYYIGVIVDPRNFVQEANEANNNVADRIVNVVAGT